VVCVIGFATKANCVVFEVTVRGRVKVRHNCV